uniref:Uncharacterized protein n=1 Tax=Oryza nivara TaxID=4536 RepID=A0A0E0I9P3_ORYNI
MAVGMATVVVEFRESNDDAAFGNGLGRAAPSGGRVRAAGTVKAVALFADPAMARRPAVEGSCGAGGLHRPTSPLASVGNGGGWLNRAPRSRSGASSVGVEWCGVRSPCKWCEYCRWHLGASAVDALVDRGSEVKILLRSSASNGDALGHLYQCQVFAGFPEINCAVNARMSSSSDVSATMPCSRSAPQGRGQQGRGKTVGVADTSSSDESGALNDGPTMALVEEHLAAMAMDMGQELSRKIPIIEISNVRLFALHLCGSALASNPQMYGGRATKIM